MKSRTYIWLVPCLILSLTAHVFAMAGTPPKKKIMLPDGALNALQITERFSGQTALATFKVKNKVEVYYFAEDGQVVEVRKGFQQNGRWYVREDGRLCIDLEGEHKDCRMIIKEGNMYHQYAAKLDGQHRYEQTYTEFIDGNQLQSLSPSPLLPEGTLSADELTELFSDKTVESVTASQGRVSLTYYTPDGRVTQLRNEMQRNGRWRVTNSGRMCLQMENLDEKCRIIVKEGNEYKKFIVKKNGRHQHSVSYRSFVNGKQF